MENETSKTNDLGNNANLLLATAFTESLEIIRKRFPISVTIEETEYNSMKNNQDRVLLKKEFYNEYCLVEINKGHQQIYFTIFKSDWKAFEKIENDYCYGFLFAPKDKSEIFVIMNTLI